MRISDWSSDVCSSDLFVDEAGFAEKIARGDFLEHAEVFGRRYGTGLSETRALLDAGHDVILDIDWQGARQVKREWPQAIGIFILPPSVDELERRLRSRSQDSDEGRSEEHTSELQSLMRNPYAVFCLK